MDQTQAFEFLQAADAPGIRPGLSRVRELLGNLGNPQDNLRFIHIEGTNGKGSVAVMLASILQAAGYRVGLFTSPFLVRYNEQIRIDGEEVADAVLFDALERVKAAADQMEEPPSSFERFMPAAFLCFAEAACDIVVLETGMGGRLDATNVISSPEAVIITRIDMDHMAFLGDTIEAIAAEKAGIIKPGTEVVMIRQSAAAEVVVRAVCQACRVQLHLTEPDSIRVQSRDIDGQQFDYRARRGLFIPLPAVYQTENAAAVLDAVDVLSRKGREIPEEAVFAGLQQVRWPGRFEVLLKKPLVLLDGAHNADGAEALAETLRSVLPGRKITFVTGVLADKDYRRMTEIISPFAERFITTAPDNPRALPAEELTREIRILTDVPAETGGTMEESLSIALSGVSEDSVICVFGSLYQAGAARAFFSLKH